MRKRKSVEVEFRGESNEILVADMWVMTVGDWIDLDKIDDDITRGQRLILDNCVNIVDLESEAEFDATELTMIEFGRLATAYQDTLNPTIDNSPTM